MDEERFMEVVSDSFFPFMPLATLYLMLRRRDIIQRFFLSVFITGLISVVLKKVLAEHRPSHKASKAGIDQKLESYLEKHRVPLALEFSFPSMHTAMVFSSLPLIWDEKKVSPLLFLYSFLVGLSRVELKEHYARDVLGGAILGLVIGTIVRRLPLESRE